MRFCFRPGSVIAVVALACVSSCAHHAHEANAIDMSASVDAAKPQSDGSIETDAGNDADGGAGPTIVIAAAGDISDTTMTSQKATSDLIVAGHYDAVLTLGDNQYNDGTNTEFSTYFAPTWGRFKANIFPAPGNHEYGTNTPVPAGGYFNYFFNTAPLNTRIAPDGGASDPTRGYYSYDLGAWHLIALNTNTAATENEACGKIACNTGSAQELWLRADLEAHKNTRCVLAYWHQARFTAGSHANDADLAALWSDLYEYDADVVLNGHDHNYQRFTAIDADGGADPQHGIVEFIVGTGGTHIVAATSSNPSTLAAHENPTESDSVGFGILELTLHPTSYDYKFIGVPGTTFTDQGSGICH